MISIKSVLLVGGVVFNGILSAYAADVTITVNGRVIAKPCTVSTPSATVDLGNLFTSDYMQPGAKSVWHTVTLNLTNCPTSTSRVTATFTGATDATGYYKNQGSAANLQLELQDSSGNNLNNGKTIVLLIDSLTQSASLPLQVRALSVNGNAKQGSIRTVINVAYTYS
ncbi:MULTISPECIES: type 1 fimbrial protein [unclassified Serratia (in: enterobacteria)]|uniref:fimbrial protein n=1 Tax=unclassified Serratia (in: enterobacteria) TaxID=2647522 RepID=UPI0027E5FCAF|nr:MULTISPECIES: type 1 fimbrial protein [unclassified Serratia (in: enterobacteria)]MDQ7099070.1 type 1 fimbrial protein [Serratia sp. MF2]MDQ7105576.1 type 1 fimbrial protein [Serratia sp. MF1(2023)]